MKYLTLILITAMLFPIFGFAQNNIIVYYKPVQTNVIGKPLISYRTGQALFGNLLPNIITKDEPSSNEDNDEFERKFTIGIKKILTGKSVKSVKVHAYNVVVSNIANQVATLPFGSQIVMSGLKADSVTITIEKDNAYKLTLSELLDQIKAYAAVSSASALNLITLIDSVGYAVNKIVKISVKNPNVFYAMIVGQTIQNYAGNAYYNMVNGKPITLNNQNPSTKSVRVKMSNLYTKIGFPVDISLYYKITSDGKPQLYASATKAEGGTIDTLISKIDDTHWRSTNLLLISPDVPGKITKKYYVDISATLGQDGKSIIITDAKIRYPEWLLSAVPEKKLNK